MNDHLKNTRIIMPSVEMQREIMRQHYSQVGVSPELYTRSGVQPNERVGCLYIELGLRERVSLIVERTVPSVEL